jgi:hypothetical protein
VMGDRPDRNTGETRIHDMMDRLNVDKPALVRVKTTR